MAERGYIVIADITGYTAFLSESELDHAQDSLRSLLELLVSHTLPPLIISRLEGDAVIAYSPSGSFLQGQTLIELLENTYVAFRQARERMQLNTTCTCNACRNIPNLDLKFLVHFGTFVLQDMLTYRELVGSDVNLAHRLLKNHITETTGITAYAAYTVASVEELGILELCLAMRPHRESYEHLGEVGLYVQDMQAVWERERQRRRVFVEPEEALLVLEMEIPAPAPLVWDYITKPEYRRILMEADSMRRDDPTAGRVSSGTVYYCAHGKTQIPQTVMDWRPFEYYTYESNIPQVGTHMMFTVRLIPSEAGTRVQMLCAKSTGPLLKRKVTDQVVRSQKNQKEIRRGMETLRQIILKELEEGVAVRQEPVSVAPEQISAAAQASLAG